MISWKKRVNMVTLGSNGADAIAAFIEKFLHSQVFMVTGGACAFMVDSIGRNPKLEYIPFQHEQSAAMAADSIWRTTGKVGVTMATSGPGATNLITGIACSWFDSIPSFHITGQVNQSESKKFLNVNVRQAGFQETDIAEMVKPITKKSVQVQSLDELIDSLPDLLSIALSDRKGPVLIDVPMNIQKEMLNDSHIEKIKDWKIQADLRINDFNNLMQRIENFIGNADRPLVIIGAGCALSGKSKLVQEWCEDNSIPFVSSWGSMPYLNRSSSLYQGSIGVYGSRHANYCVQSADAILVLGSRLDNRQRTGNPYGFAPFAKLLVLDVDIEELKKFKEQSNYETHLFNLEDIDQILNKTAATDRLTWIDLINSNKNKTKSGFEEATETKYLNPYLAIQKLQSKFDQSSIVVSDCGANLCWVYQSYLPDDSFLFTAGGNSPMGYSLPAAIGAALSNPGKTVYCFIGDGGLQMNIQELQTIIYRKLPIKIIIQNNYGYGIIKQFQDSYFGSRYFATGDGYSVPAFEGIVKAYGFERYTNIKSLQELDNFTFIEGTEVVNLELNENSLITPKTEMDRFIHDQFPYIEDGLISRLPYNYPKQPSQLKNLSNPTV